MTEMPPAGARADAAHYDDPSALLERVFGELHREPLADLPLLHPWLDIEAVGFQRWHAYWVGPLITPWLINVILVPSTGGATVLGEGEKRHFALPSGDYTFTGGQEPSVGRCLLCLLLSPVHGVPDHGGAVTLAPEVMELLLQPTAETLAEGESSQRSAPCGRAAEADHARRDFLNTSLAAPSEGRGRRTDPGNRAPPQSRHPQENKAMSQRHWLTGCGLLLGAAFPGAAFAHATAATGLGFGTGFLAATTGLHLVGMTLGRPRHWRLGALLLRAAGAVTAGLGAALLEGFG